MKTPKVIFYLKADKAKVETGEQPIYCRITVDGKRSNISINRWVHPKRWRETDKLQKARKNEDQELNFYMESIRTKIKEIERELIDSKTPVTAENIKNAYTGNTSKSKTVIEIFEWHNQNFQDMVKSEERSKGTLDRYECVLAHVKEFIKLKYKRNDIALDELTFPFVTEFEHYLRSTRIGNKGRTNKCGNNSAVKYIRNFRKVIKLAVDQGWLKFDLFTSYKGKVRVGNPTYLTPEEIKKIESKDISNTRLNLIRDIFTFTIYAGYAYIDVKHLKYSNLHRHIDGELWIFAKRQKNGVDENVMVLEPALQLIDKYRDHPLCKRKGVLFPIPSNQKVNTYLKELADICGIEKNLTFHVARHTFATSIMLANGAPMETVMAAIGHKHMKQTQHYARVLNSKVSADMKKINERLKTA